MKEVLLSRLIDSGHVVTGTEITTTVSINRGLSGRRRVETLPFGIYGFQKDPSGNIVLELVFHDERSSLGLKIGVDKIELIDGMTPERFAENYLIDPDGNDIIITAKKRGRRSRADEIRLGIRDADGNLIEDENDIEDEDEDDFDD